MAFSPMDYWPKVHGRDESEPKLAKRTAVPSLQDFAVWMNPGNVIFGSNKKGA